MPESSARGQPERRIRLALRCAVMPGMLLARGDYAASKRDLLYLVHLAQTGHRDGESPVAGLIPRNSTDHHPDGMANLWFIRAAHYFTLGAQNPEDQAFAKNVLLPMRQRIVQDFVASGGIDGIRMDDGGLLVAAPSSPAAHEGVGNLRLNALWYSALDTTGVALKSAAKRDHAGDHFERLAGRFRRSFAKAYWCEEHDRICTPESRVAPDHGALPDAEQLLLAVLPASPLPRTKQRHLLASVVAKGLGEMGVLLQHPTHGLVESPLHRAWLIQGLLTVGSRESVAMAEAARLIAPLLALRELVMKEGICAFYRDGVPLPRQRHDPLTTAEVLGAITMLRIPS